AASTANVPLPCIGTHTCECAPDTMSSRRSRTSAVIALKLESHEPQSRSIATFVASDVVSGPGVSNTGSRLAFPIAFLIRLNHPGQCADAFVGIRDRPSRTISVL